MTTINTTPTAWHLKDVRNGEVSLTCCMESVSKALAENQYIEVTALYSALIVPAIPDYDQILGKPR